MNTDKMLSGADGRRFTQLYLVEILSGEGKGSIVSIYLFHKENMNAVNRHSQLMDRQEILWVSAYILYTEQQY